MTTRSEILAQTRPLRVFRAGLYYAACAFVFGFVPAIPLAVMAEGDLQALGGIIGVVCVVMLPVALVLRSVVSKVLRGIWSDAYMDTPWTTCAGERVKIRRSDELGVKMDVQFDDGETETLPLWFLRQPGEKFRKGNPLALEGNYEDTWLVSSAKTKWKTLDGKTGVVRNLRTETILVSTVGDSSNYENKLFLTLKLSDGSVEEFARVDLRRV
jgi:hypothetical protein